MISFSTRQKFRQMMQSLEKADEIVDGLNEFLNRFIILSGEFSSNQWETLFEYTPDNNTTVMITYSVIGKENTLNQAGFKRTSLFYKESNVVHPVKLQQLKVSLPSYTSVADFALADIAAFLG